MIIGLKLLIIQILKMKKLNANSVVEETSLFFCMTLVAMGHFDTSMGWSYTERDNVARIYSFDNPKSKE